MRRRSIGPRIVSKIRRTKVQAYGSDSEWTKISSAVIYRDGGRCTRCKRSSAVGNRLHAHHIIPVSRGGRTVMMNLTTLCSSCHAKQPGHQHMQ